MSLELVIDRRKVLTNPSAVAQVAQKRVRHSTHFGKSAAYNLIATT